MRTVIGLLSDFDEAKRTAKDLERVGLEPKHISVVSRRAGNASMDGIETSSMDLGGLGRVTAGGPLLQYLTPETARSSPDALVGSLMRMGVPPDEAQAYVQGVQNGYTLEAAIVDDDHANEALEIMRRHALSGDQLESGATAERSGAIGTGSGNTDARYANRAGEEQRIPIAEEQIAIGKRQVSAGGVRVSTHVLEQPVSEQVTLREERIDVERRPVNRSIDADDAAFREGSIEVVATAEEPVVAKQARVVEEVVVRKDVTNRSETVRDTVRRTDVKVEQLRGYDRNTYTNHFTQSQASIPSKQRGSFDDYEPAYRFGHQLRGDQRYANADWNTVESDARTNWETERPGTWERFKDAVRHAWERAKE